MKNPHFFPRFSETFPISPFFPKGWTRLMRKSGILMHISSLPGAGGIGSLGKEAYAFADFLEASGMKLWQGLPMGPTGYGDSPYQAFSTFAGNPYFISPDDLVKKGYLTENDCIRAAEGTSGKEVHYDVLFQKRLGLLRKAYANSSIEADVSYQAFVQENSEWLADYALFMAIKDNKSGKSYLEWEDAIRLRSPEAMVSYRNRLLEDVNFYQFVQYEFYTQWAALKKYANDKGISIIGDIPIYVALDSADTWAHPELFQFDENGLPTAVAGCPPDAFSATGQLWGNPLYRWDVHKNQGYSWWISRIKTCYELYDMLRIDHFRGFDEYYAIPYGDATAEFGEWEKGPGIELFETLENQMGKLPILAEDLGFLTDSVRKLLADSGFPGMKVLQFAFDSREPSNYLPHNYDKNCVVYTGTHDNETLAGWYRELKKEDKKFALRYMGRKKLSVNEAVWEIIRLAQSSVADTCIIPIQDYLCLGNEARINHPSTLGGNWIWRLHRDEISKKLVKKIRRMTELYCRIPEKTEMLLKAEDAEDLGEEKK